MSGDIPSLAGKLLNAFALHDKMTAFTVAISGIDASGKGYISKLLQEELENCGYFVANINIDPWQNPIPVRMQKENAAENFYHNVFRWNEVFEQLLMPLKKNRSICLQTKLIRSDADEYYCHTYQYEKIDFLLVDAILLLQSKYLSFFDFKIWIDCSFETGLKRAIQRNVEKLDEARLIHDYDKYYYATQRLHFEKDNPRQAADLIFNNDPNPDYFLQTRENSGNYFE
jgi:uridine kinase